MGLFDNEAEKQRKKILEALEDKRVALAASLKAAGLKSEAAFYGQTGGGFHGLALCGGNLIYLTGPGPNEEGDFTFAVHPGAVARVEDIQIKAEGVGGFLGFGKKGGVGFRLHLTFPDGTEGDVEIVAGQNCYLEIEKGVDPLFDTKRRRGNANFVWEFKPVERDVLQKLLDRWLPRIQNP